MTKPALLIGSLAVLAGCSVGHHVEETKGRTHSSIVNGKASTSSQDAAVYLSLGEGACTGSLIAPNLILTARHCVAEPEQGETECVSYGESRDPSTIEVHLGAGASSDSPADALGKRITVPATSDMCGFDVALVELDRDLTGVKIAPVRFTALAANEPTVAAGYGIDGEGQDVSSRMQRSTKVLGVGPKALQYKTKAGKTVDYELPEGDVATGEATCSGDSGGPLFDAQGRVVAVTSRGIGVEGDENGDCVDLPSVYAGVRFNEATIRLAAKAAGHELPKTGDAKTSDSGDPSADDPAEKSPKKKKGEDSAADADPAGAAPAEGAGDATNGADPDEKEAKPKSAKDKSGTASGATPPASTLGCAAAPGRTSSGSWLCALAVSIALARLRRRRTSRA